ncbi:hypothetical protein AB1Y20_017360 [Prymnesium parvum]|uniref:Protein xylosyltransferase n=1 Tax=Prymnesium parvum TaxID=97485 RepID=A0AB34JP60_PRYPA
MWKNTLAFAWGLARLAACVTHVVHVDNDILLRRLPAHVANASWVERAVAVLEANESLMSVHPTRGGGPACGAKHGLPYCRCANKLANKMDVRWAGPATRQSGGLYFLHSARQPLADAREACLLTYVGPHKPDVPHFSIQAFVLDVTRFQRIFPLDASHELYDGNSSSVGERARAVFLKTFETNRGIVRAEGRVDPESIFEERARSVGLGVVFMAPSELGIEKIVNPRRGSSALG